MSLETFEKAENFKSPCDLFFSNDLKLPLALRFFFWRGDSEKAELTQRRCVGLDPGG